MNNSNRQKIFEAIIRERNYQDEKWGTILENPHTIFEWIGIMERELQEAKSAYFQRPADSKMLEEILQVISVGVACVEQHGIIERMAKTQIQERIDDNFFDEEYD